MELDVELKGLDKVVAKLNPDIYKRALNTSINKTGSRVKTQATKEIRTKYNMKARDIKKYMNVRRSRYSHMAYSLEISSKTRNIIHFGATKSKRGTKVKIKKESGVSTVKGAFIGNKGRTVFRRVKGTKMQSNPKKEKIKAVHTLSVPQMVRPNSQKKIMSESEDHFKKTFKHQLEYYLGKSK